MPPTPPNLAAMAQYLPEESHHWGVIGLEDNLHLPHGTMARSNGHLIAKARRMTQDVGRRPATVDEVRRLLALPERAAA